MKTLVRLFAISALLLHQVATADVVDSGWANVSWASQFTPSVGSPAFGQVAGFVVRYGPMSRIYTAAVNVRDPTAKGATITGLMPGTWYFVVTAIDYAGNESQPSYEVSKTIDPPPPPVQPVGTKP